MMNWSSISAKFQIRTFSRFPGLKNEVSNLQFKIPKVTQNIPNNRILRRITDTNSGPSEKLYECSTFTTCESYNLPEVIQILHAKGYKDANFLIPEEAVHLNFPNYDDRTENPSSKLKSDIFILNNGSVVGWNFSECYLEKNFLNLIKKAEVKPYPIIESEDLDYVLKTNNYEPSEETSGSGMIQDVIVIDCKSESQMLLDKAAFSFGLSRSTKLAILESLLEKRVQDSKIDSESFSKFTNYNYKKRNRSLNLIGKLLLIRGDLNLNSGLIETPDLYWSEPRLEKLYKQISKNLDIEPRIEILNKKLDYATEEARTVLSVLNDEKGSYLEWIIIYLITVEVCFELFHFYEKYTEKTKDSK